jgi:ubiquinone/menaquinone biosynthesis C-methylase UbiE
VYKGVRLNLRSKNTEDRVWELEEESYWESKSYQSLPGRCFNHRILERDKFVFHFLRDKMKGKRLLEVGCGTATTVRDLLNPLQYGYFYVGTDIASKPMRFGKKFIRSGDFVQCVCGKMPFGPNIFDVLLCLGVIHHLPGGEDNIPLLSRSLRKNGYFVACEEVLVKSAFSQMLSNAWGTKFENQFGKPSPREKGLDRDSFIEKIRRIGDIVVFRKNNSPVMGLLLYLVYKISVKVAVNRIVLELVFLLDQLAIEFSNVGIKFLDGGAYFVIARKK